MTKIPLFLLNPPRLSLEQAPPLPTQLFPDKTNPSIDLSPVPCELSAPFGSGSSTKKNFIPSSLFPSAAPAPWDSLYLPGKFFLISASPGFKRIPLQQDGSVGRAMPSGNFVSHRVFSVLSQLPEHPLLSRSGFHPAFKKKIPSVSVNCP